jgi:hypothetical protein
MSIGSAHVHLKTAKVQLIEESIHQLHLLVVGRLAKSGQDCPSHCQA